MKVVYFRNGKNQQSEPTVTDSSMQNTFLDVSVKTLGNRNWHVEISEIESVSAHPKYKLSNAQQFMVNQSGMGDVGQHTELLI